MPDINSFRDDLINLDPYEFYLKHIIKMRNWYFSEVLGLSSQDFVDGLDMFKEIVSKGLNVNFHSIQIVGSAKTGFSLSPLKLFKPFTTAIDESGETSDIDVAIISDKMFRDLWDQLRKGIRVYNSFDYRQITVSVFRGYINDKNLLRVDRISKYWNELTNSLNVSLQDKLKIVHPITYRIYRSWEDLEDYQMIGIKNARRKLED